jgi:hypothetical protein
MTRGHPHATLNGARIRPDMTRGGSGELLLWTSRELNPCPTASA